MPTDAKRDVALHLSLESLAGAHGNNRKVIAKLGEELAARFLQQNGFRILDRNWHSGRFGEIDLIAVNAMGLLVFAEVKTRKWSPDTAGFCDGGFDAINWKKRRKILNTARSYLGRNRHPDTPARLDAILVQFKSVDWKGKEPSLLGVEVLHVAGAFDSV